MHTMCSEKYVRDLKFSVGSILVVVGFAHGFTCILLSFRYVSVSLARFRRPIACLYVVLAE
jgi:hypothetical protein